MTIGHWPLASTQPLFQLAAVHMGRARPALAASQPCPCPSRPRPPAVDGPSLVHLPFLLQRPAYVNYIDIQIGPDPQASYYGQDAAWLSQVRTDYRPTGAYPLADRCRRLSSTQDALHWPAAAKARQRWLGKRRRPASLPHGITGMLRMPCDAVPRDVAAHGTLLAPCF